MSRVARGHSFRAVEAKFDGAPTPAATKGQRQMSTYIYVSPADVTYAAPSQEAVELAERAEELADEGGIIQAHQMLEITSEPRYHTTMRLEHVWTTVLGLEEVAS